jgi:hypothetical protein
METLCKNFEKCPIYTGILEGKNATAGSYKKKYCEAGEEGWNKCKRYVVKERTGKCPPNLLPNSIKDIEMIIKEMNRG